MINAFLSALDLLIPNECHICQRPLFGEFICANCNFNLPKIESGSRCLRCWEPSENCSLCEFYPYPFNHLRTLWCYDHDARIFIHAAKYRPSQALCKYAGHLLIDSFDRLFDDSRWDLLIPMPPSSQGERKRGFNQSQIMAQEIVRNYPQRFKNLSNNVLKRSIKAAPQSHTSSKTRIRKRARLFNVSKSLLGQKILLVDDVFTTGTTATEATLKLLEAGAVSVDLLVLARSPKAREVRAELYNSVVADYRR